MIFMHITVMKQILVYFRHATDELNSFQKQMSENRKMALHGELSSIVNELKSEMYKNAGIKYRDKMIILKVSDMYIQGEKKCQTICRKG